LLKRDTRISAETHHQANEPEQLVHQNITNTNPAKSLAKALLFFLAEDRQRYFINMPIVLISEAFEFLPAFLTRVMITILMY